MAFGMFAAASSPIAIDFGSSSVKLLQVSGGNSSGERPQILAAAELPISEALRNDQESLMLFYAQELPKLLKQGHFRGKRVVTAIPSGQTLIQHMQIAPTEGGNRDDIIRAQIEAQMNCAPRSTVVRSFEVKEVHRGGQQRTEMICFAVTRHNVMRYIEMLKKLRLEVAGMHTETVSMARSFEHLYQRDSDKNATTLFVDMGWAGTRVAITHGKQLMFARYIQVGGKHFDQLIAQSLHCDLATARSHRIALRGTEEVFRKMRQHTGAPGEGSALLNTAMDRSDRQVATAVAGAGGDDASSVTSVMAVNRRTGQMPPELAHEVRGTSSASSLPDNCPVDLSELLDTVTDELSMCLRYHSGLFPERRVDRAIFLGGESRQVWLCQHVVRQLQLPAQLGDPLARFAATDRLETPNLDRSQPQPGWAVACGLCNAPTDI